MTNTAKPLDLQTNMDEAVTSLEQFLDPVEDKPEEAQAELQADETVEEEVDQEEELQADDPEEVEVTIDELQNSYSRQKDYTRKTQELAQQRKAVEQQQGEVAKNETIYKELLPKMESALKEGLGDEPDWNALYQADPIGYVRERDLWNEKQQKLQAVQGEQARLQEEAQAKHAEQVSAYMQYGDEQLIKNHVPEWKDKSIAQKEKLAIREHAINDLGFTAEEINQVYDYRLLLGLRNSWMQNKTQKAVKKKPTQKASARNRVGKPGSVTRKNNSTSLKRSKQRLAKTGKVHDAAKVFEQLI